jgi:hypothetical protein
MSEKWPMLFFTAVAAGYWLAGSAMWTHDREVGFRRQLFGLLFAILVALFAIHNTMEATPRQGNQPWVCFDDDDEWPARIEDGQPVCHAEDAP